MSLPKTKMIGNQRYVLVVLAVHETDLHNRPKLCQIMYPGMKAKLSEDEENRFCTAYIPESETVQ